MRQMMKRFRKALLFAVLAAAAGLYMAAPSAHAQGKEIKELIIAIGVDADTLNPQEQTTTLIQNMCDLIYDNLFYQDPAGKLHPRLATKYEVSADGLTYTISLRKGVKFSDGTDFNADAVKLTFDRALDPKMRVPLRFAIGMVKECVKVDDHTVALKLNYPFAPLAPTLSLTLVSTISPAAIQKYGDEVRQNPVGAGPYVLKEWVKGDRLVFVRNEKYYGDKP
ncbi:MAG: ABC transporter substrate-binding protein, partial [Hyphomicrobiales bacterium]